MGDKDQSAVQQVERAAARLSPKLRMVANCSAKVNAVRAEHSAALCVSPRLAKRLTATESRGPTAQGASVQDVLAATSARSLGVLRGSRDVTVHVVVKA